MEKNATYHFKNYRKSIATGKYYMTCIYCRKELVDSKNSNCKVSHLYSCRPDKCALLSNNIQNFPTREPVVIEIGGQVNKFFLIIF